jgi:hypothetical protein
VVDKAHDLSQSAGTVTYDSTAPTPAVAIDYHRSQQPIPFLGRSERRGELDLREREPEMAQSVGIAQSGLSDSGVRTRYGPMTSHDSRCEEPRRWLDLLRQEFKRFGPVVLRGIRRGHSECRWGK